MKKVALIVISSLLAGVSAQVMANTGEVYFSGVVSDTTCTLNVAQGGIAQADNTITLEPITTGEFLASDTAYNLASFSLIATDAGSAPCTLTGKGAAVLWSGQLYVGHNILQNTASGGAAGVGVMLLESDGSTAVQMNGTPVSVVDASGGELTFNAGYGATDAASVTEGQVRSVANYSVVFN